MEENQQQQKKPYSYLALITLFAGLMAGVGLYGGWDKVTGFNACKEEGGIYLATGECARNVTYCRDSMTGGIMGFKPNQSFSFSLEK